MKPNKRLIKMQDEAMECSRVRFIEIIEHYRNYLDIIVGTNGNVDEAKAWLESLRDISLERFGADLVGYPSIDVDQLTRDDYLIKYKMTDSTRSIYYGIKTKEPITKFEAELWIKLNAIKPTSGQQLVTWNNLKKKIIS